MADRGSITLEIRLDVQQLQSEAQNRWLRPAEICEILRNYQKFKISSESPYRPQSGSLFLFDRNILRYFRKDGHNWRKKKDGRTVKEAHEKLKVGSVDVLHCYYAHGEENEYFQRRCYWLLEEEFMHIVFVHYLEAKGKRTSVREKEPVISNSQLSNPLSVSVSTSYKEAYAGNAGSPSATSSLSSPYDDSESEDNQQALSKYPSSLTNPLREDSFESSKMVALMNSKFFSALADEYRRQLLSNSGLDYVSLTQRGSGTDDNQFRPFDSPTWEGVFKQCTRTPAGLPHHLVSSTLAVSSVRNEDNGGSQLLGAGLGINSDLGEALAPYCSQRRNPLELQITESEDHLKVSLTNKQSLIGSIKAKEILQKVHSFSKWMTKELDSVEDLDLKSSSNHSWQNIETAAAVDDHSEELNNYSMRPSIDQDQLFDIYDFSPICAYSNMETKVLITGRFLVSQSEITEYSWSCMFGELEVPAKVIGDGVLHCYAPMHSAGRIPFYVTCSNRFACSQVREFEYLEEPKNVKSINISGSTVKEKQICLQLEKLLALRAPMNYSSISHNMIKKQPIVNKISLLVEDELCRNVDPILKEKVVLWLLDKVVNDDGKGPNILDEEGQGLLHLAAALGYDWIIPLTLAAGVSVNFRDVNRWTALHWAACHGREKAVALLIALGAAPGLLMDPSPEFPLARTPADLASDNGYKGIAGYLAESSLTAHLASLAMNGQNSDSSLQFKAVEMVKERVATPGYDNDGSDLPLKDSLAALRNATQAAGRIHQVFRMQSFQRKQKGDSVDNESLLADECVLSLISYKIQKPRHADEVNSAAIRIQKKFRGWTKRKEFLVICERIVKIQAHVRGHQVRKRYRTVVWSVGILEKLILRWRRKGTGLREFFPDALNKVPMAQTKPFEEADYDYLKEGRKQTEERLQKALVRVKSMVQYPEGRAQYRRLLTAVEDFQKNQQSLCSKILDDSPFEVEEDIFDDDNFMSVAFE